MAAMLGGGAGDALLLPGTWSFGAAFVGQRVFLWRPLDAVVMRLSGCLTIGYVCLNYRVCMPRRQHRELHEPSPRVASKGFNTCLPFARAQTFLSGDVFRMLPMAPVFIGVSSRTHAQATFHLRRVTSRIVSSSEARIAAP